MSHGLDVDPMVVPHQPHNGPIWPRLAEVLASDDVAGKFHKEIAGMGFRRVRDV